MTTPAFKRVQYVVKTTGDRFFIPVNNDVHGGGDGDMADQLDQCEILSPNGEELVAS